jgi:hypothetical protein
MVLTNISPPAEAGQAIQGLFFEIASIPINIFAALPLTYAAEQQNICSKVIARICQSFRAAKY